jgi:hypothetical protein
MRQTPPTSVCACYSRRNIWQNAPVAVNEFNSALLNPTPVAIVATVQERLARLVR